MGTEPRTTSLEQAGTDLVGSALSGLGAPDGMASTIANLVLGGLKTFIGNDEAFRSTLSTNMTASGNYGAHVRSNIAYMAKSAAGSYANEHMRHVIENFERTATSMEDWSRLPGSSGSAKDYEKYIQDQVQGRMQNPLIGTVYDWANRSLDIGGSYTTAKNLQNVAANGAMWRLAYGDTRGAMTGGRALAENLLRGDYVYDRDGEGSYIITQDGKARMGHFAEKAFDRSDWGGFDGSAVSKLAETLSQQTDFLGDTDVNNPEKLRAAVERFQRTTKQYAEALSPLKDIFGDDVDSMVSTMESISGQAISHMAPEKANRLAENLADHLNSGRVTMNDIVMSTSTMQNYMNHMPQLGTWNYMSTAMQGMAALDAFNGAGVLPSYMTRGAAKAHAAEFVAKTYNSSAADMMAKAYSLWAHNNEGNGDNSFAAFSALMESDRYKGKDPRRVARELAGVRTEAELNQGLAYKYYEQAVTSGDAGQMSLSSAVDQQIRQGERRMGRSYGYRKAIGAKNSAEARSTYNAVMNLVKDDPSIANMGDDELAEYMQSQVLTGADGQVIYDDQGRPVSRYSADDIDKAQRTLNYMRNSDPDTLVKVQERAQMRAVAAQRQGARNRREALKTVSAVFNGDLSQVFEGGFSMTRLRQALSADDLAKLAADPSAGALLEAAGAAGAARNPGDAAAAQRMSMDMVNYAMSAEGMSNDGFNKALADYANLSAEARAGEKGQALQDRMAAYTYGGKDVVDRLYSMDVYGENGERLTGADAARKRAQLVHDAVNANNGLSTNDNLKYAAMQAQVSGGSESMQQLYRQYAESDKYAGRDGLLQFGENWNEYYKDVQTQIKRDKRLSADEKEAKLKELGQLNDMMGAAGSGGKGEDPLVSILHLLEEAVSMYKEQSSRGAIDRLFRGGEAQD